MAAPEVPLLAPDVPEHVDVTINVAAVRQPTGRHWVKLEVLCGNTAYGLLLPPATAEQVADLIPKALGTAIGAARRADLGLLVPAGNGALPPLPS